MDRYATHIPLLVLGLLKTTGSILELGAGNYSTYILNEVSRIRKVTTVETNYQYIRTLKHLQNKNHTLIYTDNTLEYIKKYKKKYDLVFLDSENAPERGEILDIMKNYAKIIVCHDSEEPAYKYNFKGLKTIESNLDPKTTMVIL